eukprot:scaffold27785_cov108-Isochrysis_galbana.AAC.1
MDALRMSRHPAADEGPDGGPRVLAYGRCGARRRAFGRCPGGRGQGGRALRRRRARQRRRWREILLRRGRRRGRVPHRRKESPWRRRRGRRGARVRSGAAKPSATTGRFPPNRTKAEREYRGGIGSRLACGAVGEGDGGGTGLRIHPVGHAGDAWGWRGGYA